MWAVTNVKYAIQTIKFSKLEAEPKDNDNYEDDNSETESISNCFDKRNYENNHQI